MIEDNGQILHEDDFRKIIKVTCPDGSRIYKYKEMQQPCFACKNKVHRDSGKLYMTDLIEVLNKPKFLCHSCYVVTVRLVKHMIKTGGK